MFIRGQLTVAGVVQQSVALSIVGGTPNTVATDATVAGFYTIAATLSFTLSNPTSAEDGQIIIWRIQQDATGSRVITYDTSFKFGTDVPSAVLSTAPNATDYVAVRYNANTTKFDVISFIRGY